MPLLTRRRVLAAKVESTVGTAESLTASDAVFNVMDPEVSSDIEFAAREGQGCFSPLPGALGAYAGQARFTIELTGGASLPAWASTFLPACGLGITSLVLAPVSTAPEAGSSKSETITIGAYEDGVYKQLHGCMGNAVFRFPSGKVATVEFTFKGIWSAPSNVALITPTYPTTAPLRFVSSTLAIGSYAPLVSELTVDLGNEVTLRESSNTTSGYHSAVITGRAIKGTLDPESTLTGTHGAAVYDPNNDLLGRVERAMSWSMGTTGNAWAFSMPKMQITKCGPGSRNGVKVDQIEYQANRSAAAGDDEFTMTCS